jgi:predicted transcriptional regulator
MRETSIEAYDSIKPDLNIKRRKVLETIKGTGSTGATLFELVKLIGRPVNEISGRVTELSRTLMIKESGKRMNPDTGKNATIWKAVE